VSGYPRGSRELSAKQLFVSSNLTLDSDCVVARRNVSYDIKRHYQQVAGVGRRRMGILLRMECRCKTQLFLHERSCSGS
jgi:hypothetical protein